MTLDLKISCLSGVPLSLMMASNPGGGVIVAAVVIVAADVEAGDEVGAGVAAVETAASGSESAAAEIAGLSVGFAFLGCSGRMAGWLRMMLESSSWVPRSKWLDRSAFSGVGSPLSMLHSMHLASELVAPLFADVTLTRYFQQ